MTKCALITGASRGIGKQAAIYFASQGYDVALIAQNELLLEGVARDISDEYGVKTGVFSLDVSDREAVTQCVEGIASHHPSIDVLFNNAGLFEGGTSDTSPDAFDRLLAVNVGGVFNFIHAVTPIMKKQLSGYIFNLASYAGKRPLPHSGSYCLTKYGVVGYSKSLSIELAPHNIKVTAICPSVIDTDMTQHFSDFPNSEKIRVEDIVNTVDFCMKMSPQAIVDEVLIKSTFLEKMMAK